MGHVHAAVCLRAGELHVAEQPIADQIVGGPVGEEEPMRGLVHQGGELCVCATHEEESENPCGPKVDVYRDRENQDVLSEEPHDTPRVEERRNAAKSCAVGL